MNFKIIFALLILNLIQNGQSSDDMTFIEEISELNFNKTELTQDKMPQLHCSNPDNLEGEQREKAEEFCDKYGSTFIKCINPKRKNKFEEFECIATFPYPGYSLENFQIGCLESASRPEYYFKKTCSLIYRLQKGDGESKKSFLKKNLGYILGGIAGVSAIILIVVLVFI